MNRQKKMQQKGNRMNQICLIGTLVLIAALLIFLVVTMSGMTRLNSQIKLTTEHPFVVSRGVGEVRTNVAQMRIRTERLQSYNQPVDVEKVKKALSGLYLDVEQNLEEIQTLYIGPKEDADLLVNTYLEMKKYQQALLVFAEENQPTKEEITAYEETYLYPLYDTMEAGCITILGFTKNTQMTVYYTSEKLWKSTFLWSVGIVGVTILGLCLFLSLITKANRLLIYKNQQLDILSHTIDETFWIFEASKISCDFVAENSLRVLGLDAEAIKQNRDVFYQHADEEAKEKIRGKLFGDDMDDDIKELSICYQNPVMNDERWLMLRFYKTTLNNVVKHIVTITDETDEMHARRALQDALVNAQNANNAKRDFLSRMSHEIRTPMNAIIGMTTIAGANIEERTRVEDCLSKISYSSKHLLMLINDVLDMSRIESNKLAINNEPFDIYQFVNSFLAIVYTQARNKGVILTEKMIGFDEHTTYIGDSLRLNQVLLNLMSNAIKFTPSGGEIKMEVKRIPSREGKDRIRFTVEDTGIGMMPDALSRLYDPFEQANAGIAQKYGGTGLGMSIAKNLISLMGGYIDVKSEFDVGTVCMVEIPFDKSDVDIDVLSVEELKELSVLVVDDEQDMCEHTTLLLKKINIQAQWVLTGEEAVEVVAAARECGAPLDICFIDWSMPGMSGIETTKHIRERVGADTPIIIISAYDWADIEKEAREAGVNGFISKPLFLSSIYNALVNVTNGAFARGVTRKNQIHTTLLDKNILIAEDNALNLEIAEEMLKMHGAKVTGVQNGQEALERFEASYHHEFDAVLMDIQMPVMNGYEATRCIRALARTEAKTIPIIATTANAFSEDVSAALAAGMTAHVSKPIDMERLCEVLAKLLEENPMNL